MRGAARVGESPGVLANLARVSYHPLMSRNSYVDKTTGPP